MPQSEGEGSGMNAPMAASVVAAAETPALVATNDFVVKFANVNGSGSASASDDDGVIGYHAHTVAPP
jgi:hypothetical protein